MIFIVTIFDNLDDWTTVDLGQTEPTIASQRLASHPAPVWPVQCIHVTKSSEPTIDHLNGSGLS